MAEGIAEDVDSSGGGANPDLLFSLAPFGQHRPRLDRCAADATHPQPLANSDGRAREGRRGIAGREPLDPNGVPRGCGLGKVDADRVDGVVGLVLGLGGYHRNRVPFEADGA